MRVGLRRIAGREAVRVIPRPTRIAIIVVSRRPVSVDRYGDNATRRATRKALVGVLMVPGTAGRPGMHVIRTGDPGRPTVVVRRHLVRRQRHPRHATRRSRRIGVRSQRPHTDQRPPRRDLHPCPTQEGPWISIPSCDVNRPNWEHFIY